MSTDKNFPVSWDDIHRNSKALAWRLLDKQEWKGIIAVTRGGLVPACVVARELNIRLVETFCVVSYEVKEQGAANILKQPDIGTGNDWLVIDDLTDTGNTFRLIREHLPDAHFACVYVKPQGRDTADTFITEVSQDTWIHFPWDLSSQYSTPIVDQKPD